MYYYLLLFSCKPQHQMPLWMRHRRHVFLGMIFSLAVVLNTLESWFWVNNQDRGAIFSICRRLQLESGRPNQYHFFSSLVLGFLLILLWVILTQLDQIVLRKHSRLLFLSSFGFYWYLKKMKRQLKYLNLAVLFCWNILTFIIFVGLKMQ